MRSRRHATHRTSACVQAIPAVTLPEERWTVAPQEGDGQRPAFLMPTAEADSPRAVAGRPSSTRTSEEAQAVGRVGLCPVGSFSEFLTCDVAASDSPEGETRWLERSCLRRSLCLWHRRVALRAVGLKRGKEGGRVTAVKFWQALKYCDVRLLVWGAGALASVSNSQSLCGQVPR